MRTNVAAALTAAQMLYNGLYYLMFVPGTAPVMMVLNPDNVSPTLTASRALVSDANGKVSAALVTAAELGYSSGVTSGIQAQLQGKQPAGSYATAVHTHGIGDVTGLNGQLGMRAITEINLLGRALCSSNWGTIIEVGGTTYNDLVNLMGTTGNLQSQINGKLGATARAADTTKIVGRDLYIYPSDPGGVDGDIWIQI